MNRRQKIMKGFDTIFVYCHEKYNGCDSNGQSELATINQTAKDAIELIQDLEADVKFFKEYKGVVDALLELGYPHNFQREQPWIRDYMYKITGIIKTAYDVMEGKKK